MLVTMDPRVNARNPTLRHLVPTFLPTLFANLASIPECGSPCKSRDQIPHREGRRGRVMRTQGQIYPWILMRQLRIHLSAQSQRLRQAILVPRCRPCHPRRDRVATRSVVRSSSATCMIALSSHPLHHPLSSRWLRSAHQTSMDPLIPLPPLIRARRVWIL